MKLSYEDYPIRRNNKPTMQGTFDKFYRAKFNPVDQYSKKQLAVKRC